MKKNKILLLIALFIFIGCKNRSETPEVDSAISEVVAKFPQLTKGGTEHYQLEKSVKNGKYNFEIQLYSENDTVKDPQKILVFINAQKQYYAIPFFSNTYRDYWGFKNEILLPNIKKVQSTFTRQYLDALINLKLNKIEVSLSVTNDLLISVLDCEKITSCDFLSVKDIIFTNDKTSLDSEDNSNELKIKWAKSNEEILKTKNSGIGNYNVLQVIGYFECKNYRFHQVILGNDLMNIDKNPQKVITSEKDLVIKSYRKDRIGYMINL